MVFVWFWFSFGLEKLGDDCILFANLGGQLAAHISKLLRKESSSSSPASSSPSFSSPLSSPIHHHHLLHQHRFHCHHHRHHRHHQDKDLSSNVPISSDIKQVEGSLDESGHSFLNLNKAPLHLTFLEWKGERGGSSSRRKREVPAPQFWTNQ